MAREPQKTLIQVREAQRAGDVETLILIYGLLGGRYPGIVDRWASPSLHLTLHHLRFISALPPDRTDDINNGDESAT